jgi:hypothetical protein
MRRQRARASEKPIGFNAARAFEFRFWNHEGGRDPPELFREHTSTAFSEKGSSSNGFFIRHSQLPSYQKFRAYGSIF